MLETLQKLGLSKGEIKVYSAILNTGIAPVNKIHEQTGIERRNIYDILNKLIERGLITYMDENKRRSYQIAHPDKILQYIDEKKEELEQTKKEVAKEIPSILEKFHQKSPEIKAEVYRGLEGMKAVWDDMLRSKAIYWIGAGRYMPKQYSHYFNQWNKKRAHLKIKIYNLLRHELKKEVIPYPLEQTKFLPEEFSGSPTVIGIYGNKVVNFLFGENLFAFVIESKELAENYKRYHKYLWEKVAKS